MADRVLILHDEFSHNDKLVVKSHSQFDSSASGDDYIVVGIVSSDSASSYDLVQDRDILSDDSGYHSEVGFGSNPKSSDISYGLDTVATVFEWNRRRLNVESTLTLPLPKSDLDP